LDANKPIVKVKADYESFPLWQHDSAELANIDPATLPISPELVQELLDWADTYGRTVNSSHPLASGFPYAAAEDAFCTHGESLARRLAVELDPRYAVEYFDARSGQGWPIT